MLVLTNYGHTQTMDTDIQIVVTHAQMVATRANHGLTHTNLNTQTNRDTNRNLDIPSQTMEHTHKTMDTR